MTPETNRENLLKVAQADHESILSVTENVFRFIGCPDSPDAAKEFHTTQRLINEVLGNHFTYEENQLFPSLLAHNSDAQTTQVIAKLRQEHTSLLEQARLFSEKFAGGYNLDERRDELWQTTTHLVSALENHVAKEERLFESFA